MTDFLSIDALLRGALDTAFPAAQLVIYRRGALIHATHIGRHDPEHADLPIQADTRFDLASVSKLFTVAALMRLVEQGRAALDQPLCAVLPEFTGLRPIQPQPDPTGSGAFIPVVPVTDARVDASAVTFRHLLTHTSGLPAWLPLWKEALALQRAGATDDAIQQHLRSMLWATAFAYPTGAHVVYSDIGLILTGLAIERITGLALDAAVRKWVTEPLGLASIGYGPIPCAQAAPTEVYAHHGRRMCGEVHDENAYALHGRAGHAGLFGHARDVAAFGEALRRSLAGDGAFLSAATLREMTRLQAQDGDVRRGIGFALRSPNPDAMSHALSAGAFGHLGFTGTALWIDPERELVFAFLTNHIYYGRAGKDTLTSFRTELTRALVAACDRL